MKAGIGVYLSLPNAMKTGRGGSSKAAPVGNNPWFDRSGTVTALYLATASPCGAQVVLFTLRPLVTCTPPWSPFALAGLPRAGRTNPRKESVLRGPSWREDVCGACVSLWEGALGGSSARLYPRGARGCASKAAPGGALRSRNSKDWQPLVDGLATSSACFRWSANIRGSPIPGAFSTILEARAPGCGEDNPSEAGRVFRLSGAEKMRLLRREGSGHRGDLVKDESRESDVGTRVSEGIRGSSESEWHRGAGQEVDGENNGDLWALLTVKEGAYFSSYCQAATAVSGTGSSSERATREEDREGRKARRQEAARAGRRRTGRDCEHKKNGPRREAKPGNMQNSRVGGEELANPLKDLTQATLNEPLKQHNAAALKLVQTVSEFAQELGAAMESHSANVRRLVDEFRGRAGDPRIDVGGMRRVWESLLRQVEADAAAHLDLAAVLQQQLSRPTLESSFHRKLQSRKVFAHREAYEQVVNKTEEKLQRARVDYKRAYAALLTADSTCEPEMKRAYLEAHNAYVLQLRATNAITERYQFHCLPGLLGEIAEVYEELSGLACKCVSGVSEAAGERAGEQAKRYQGVAKEVQVVAPLNDLQVLARSLASNTTPRKPPRRLFVAPAPPEQIPMERISQIPSLRDELVPSGTSTLPLMEDLRRDYDSLNQEIGRLQDALDTLMRMQRKSAESNLYTKVAELQEDISLKRFDLGVAQLHLAAVQAQKELFGGGEAGQPDGVSSRKMSNGSTGSTKHKWLKAFKSLKTSSPTTSPPADKKNLESEGGHAWREYTYRKITPCDACGQVLRGHSRQGVRCRGCKANAHTDCINLVQPTMCPSLAPKKGGGIPLLRRQKTQAPADEPPATEHRRGSGGSTSGTRPFGQPLVLMSQDSPSTSSPRAPEPPPLRGDRGLNKKR
ncbi:hypothetical protein KM043_012578 [Ampulex compressa]|nr:hypothetical protein KM043_012578 [Ampulex compressa]